MTTAGVPTVGIIANPAAGKDIRRLVSAASSSSDHAKIGIIRRAVIGAAEGGAQRILIADDHKALGRKALHGLDDQALVAWCEIVGEETTPTSAHSRRMAELFRARAVGAIVSLGGDGTHRDIVKGWRDVALVPISTGTNNVFPQMIEATVAGHAAAVAAQDSTSIALIARRAKVLDVQIGDRADLALIDVALVTGSFTASRAVWDAALLRELIVTTAEPDTIGLSALAAQLEPVTRQDFDGVHVRFDGSGGGSVVRAAVGPGLYQEAHVAKHERLRLGRTITLHGPGVLAFDGERDHVLGNGEHVEVTLSVDGPWVIDPAAALSP